MTPEHIKSAIEQGIPGARVLVRDTRGDGNHFQAIVGSEAFQGLELLEQHRLVYGALGGAVGTEVHALAVKTCAPEAFDQVVAAS